MSLARRITIGVALLLPGVLLLVAAAEIGGGTATALAATTAVLGAGLGVLVAPRGSRRERALVGRTAALALPLLPGALLVFLSFHAGGFFPGTTAGVAVGLVLLLVFRITLSERPFEGYTRPLAIAISAMALLCLWILVSAEWSRAPARALIEFDRAFLYTAALALFGAVRWTPGRLAELVRWLALGMAAVATIALITRVLPEVWVTEASLSRARLSYPLTYESALAMISVVAAVLCFHLTSSEREPLPVRALAAAGIPLAACAAFFTYSRGPMAAGIGALVLYAVIARPRGIVAGVLAVVPLTIVALRFSYVADALNSYTPKSPEAVAEGKDLAPVLALCSLGAAAVRTVLVPLDRRLTAIRIPPRTARTGKLVLAGAAVVALLAGAVVTDAPQRLERRWDRFVEAKDPIPGEDIRERLVDVQSNLRVAWWRVALNRYERERLRGWGAGTYQTLWYQDRDGQSSVVNAHSLYIEALAELGLVGLALIALALAAVLVGLVLRARGPDRPLYAAVLAAVLAWVVHTGIDWDWEMPAVTLWVFALAGAGLSGRPGARRGRRVPHFVRVAGAIACLALAVTPALVTVSDVRLDQSRSAYARSDCAEAADTALASISAARVRPHPWEVLGYCNVLQGSPGLGVQALDEATRLDPDNWEFRYGLAIVTAAAGRDPLPAARAAAQLNPEEPLPREAVERFTKVRGRRARVSAARSLLRERRLAP